MKYAFRSFLRNGRVSLLSVAVVLVSAFFLMLFCDSISAYQVELAESYAILEVSGRIVSQSAVAKPNLTETQYQAILNSGFVSAHSIMADHAVGDSDVLRGLNDGASDPTLRDCLEEIRWAEGYSAEVLQDTEQVCIVPANQRFELGQDWTAGINGSTVTFRIVGIYGNKYHGKTAGNVYYCPIQALKAAYEQQGLALTYSGMEMDLQNLAELDDFKAQMKKLGLDSGDTRLVINDSQLQTVTSQLKRQVRLLETLLPVLLALIAAIGFGSSFLLLRGRRREAAVLRSLGMKRAAVFGAFLFENLLQAVLGLLIGCVIGWYAFGSGALQPNYLAALLGCYLLGGAVAVWKISGVNVFNIMTARE